MGLVIHLISKFSLLEYSFAILIASSSISNPVTSAPSIAAAIDSLPVPHPKSAIFPDKLPAEFTFLIISLDSQDCLSNFTLFKLIIS